MSKQGSRDFCDYHHILFQGRGWGQGWAKRLREHPYCGGYILRTTLHREIHCKIQDIPAPDGRACRIAVEAIDSWLDAGYISVDDRMDKKVEMITKCFRAKFPETAEKLDWQKEIISKFYRGG